MFINASYQEDRFTATRENFHIGGESRSQYGERYADGGKRLACHPPPSIPQPAELDKTITPNLHEKWLDLLPKGATASPLPCTRREFIKAVYAQM